ncbi:MAG: hypothetical protein AAF487_06855, partial [Bacteroidota bacterium]
NSSIFLRELLQNAIDTCRYRKVFESSINSATYECLPIEISTWYDHDGFRWIRIDDRGMGMTIDQITKYFLKVGNSFYNSDEFKVSKLDFKDGQKDFTTISKFGIGILSCFLVADEIEVSTRSIHVDKETIFPVRLSLKGLDNYYFLYTKNDIPKEMPSKLLNGESYREDTGTSIALRLNPNLDQKGFDLARLIKSNVYASDIEIKFENNLFGNEDLSAHPDEPFKYQLSKDEVLKISEFLDSPGIESIGAEIHVDPIILSDESILNVNGIIYAFNLRKTIEFKSNAEFELKISPGWKLEYYDGYNQKSTLKLNVRKYAEKHEIKSLRIDLSHLIENVKEFRGQNEFYFPRRSAIFSHNGILIPNVHQHFPEMLELNIREENSDSTLCLGIFNLKDKIRPNLNISRSAITTIPWTFFSEVNLIIKKSLKKSSFSYRPKLNNFADYRIQIESIDYNDPFLTINNGWPNEIILGSEEVKVNEVSEQKSIEVGWMDRCYDRESELLYRRVIFENCNYVIQLYKQNENQEELIEKAFIKGKKKHEFGQFPSHWVCEYENFNGLMPLKLGYSLYNIKHDFTKWLISCYSELFNNYNYFLKSILNTQSISEMNSILDKLRKLLSEELKPKLELSEDDFKVDFEKLNSL